MASTTDFTSVRRRISPITGAFFAPSDVTNLALIQTLASISRDLVTSYSNPVTFFSSFQRRNARALISRLKILSSLFEFLLIDSSDSSVVVFPPSVTVCFKELYILVFRSRMLLDYCSQSSKVWILLQNPQISGNFHGLIQEIGTILDVLPLKKLNLPCDLEEQVKLVHRQARKSKLYIDRYGELLRIKIFSFLDEFDKGSVPDFDELKTAFVDQLGIESALGCSFEVDFIEEQIFSSEDDDGIDASLLGGVVALIRYCRFLLFEFVIETDGSESGNNSKRTETCVSNCSVTIPKDFCCPISLDLMKDPVIVSTGQTYDRGSITQWMEEGHNTCPNSGQILVHTRLVPNKALRSLISQWCFVQGIYYEALEGSDTLTENIAAASSNSAAIQANRATAKILVEKLANGSEEEEITVAAKELRLLAKTGKENRSCIAEAGAIPLLGKLLCSSNPIAQENSVTAILNLSIHEENKMRVMEEEGCLSLIIEVLQHGYTTEARENAAATLFSLSAVHEYKKRITDEPGAVEALAKLLRNGSQRGKKDAVTALFNLSTHPECCLSMMESGAVFSLLQALVVDGIAEEAAAAIALLLRHQIVAEVMGGDDSAIRSLLDLMKRGSPKAKENAVSALLQLCKNGGLGLTQRVARTPTIGGLIQSLLFTGTKRARRKAASLARMCQRSETVVMEYAITRSSSSSVRRSSSLVGEEVSVSVAVSVL